MCVADVDLLKSEDWRVELVATLDVDFCCGVAQLDDKLYVICIFPNIQVFLAHPPYSELDGIEVNAIDGPCYIAACSVNKCLYVADRCSVWRVLPNSIINPRKLIDGIEWTRRLSVTQDGRILLAGSTHLTTYNHDGVQLQGIDLSLPDNEYCSAAAVDMPGGDILVAIGDEFRIMSSVMKLSFDGRPMATYGGRRGSGLGQLGDTRAVAVSEGGFVFVADTFNKRVLLLDSSLRLQCYLLTEKEHGIGRPRALCYIKQSRQLLVVHDDAVKVYNIQRINNVQPVPLLINNKYQVSDIAYRVYAFVYVSVYVFWGFV